MVAFLTSQVLFLGTALAVSAGTLILFDLFRDKSFPTPQLPHQNQLLKSCLSSGSKKREKSQRKKKRVQFADDVKDSKSNGNRLRRKKYRRSAENGCGNDGIHGLKKMPANRAVLYSGILSDRLRRMEYSC
ncbi:hypothetical protein Salat_2806000 [Sesamum alatum]|uniref:Uncharacterized protein n=1 Tax=Sesamum alatum TaxID=300844 RepID=A0AAE1XL85_9LAMI|nr:hypothetical protein Salat_2806000 [Sesamum alatum]